MLPHLFTVETRSPTTFDATPGKATRSGRTRRPSGEGLDRESAIVTALLDGPDTKKRINALR
jgi:hypothetical protein